MTREMTRIVDPDFGFGDKFQCNTIRFQWNFLQVEVNLVGPTPSLGEPGRETCGSNRPFWAENIRAEICFAQAVSFVPQRPGAIWQPRFKIFVQIGNAALR
jgi:hypothetical protein